ncbi:MAG: hypothetical protein AB8B51_20255, partial [Sedimentitalea sp.]
VSIPATVSAFHAENRHAVNAVNDQVFEVIGRAGSAGSDYWCAAGDYAHRVLKAGSSSRIYIVRERGTPVTSKRKLGVQFSLTAPEKTLETPGITLRVDRIGDSLNTAEARNYCYFQKNLEF